MNARMELKRYTDANFQGYSAEESRLKCRDQRAGWAV
jgi:hypothetical protein